MLTTIGLTIISIAWLYEFYLIISKKDKTINSKFAGIYSVGVLLLVIDGFMLGVSSITWLNLVSLVISAGVFMALMKK
ncbi:MAG: hypothetical protein WC933_01180 [Candidatus Paceibacterota bacterium]|jgi:hypothetical protein